MSFSQCMEAKISVYKLQAKQTCTCCWDLVKKPCFRTVSHPQILMLFFRKCKNAVFVDTHNN